MSELQFPKDPIVGQEYNYAPYKYRWDGIKWKTIGIGYNPVNDLRDELEPRIETSEKNIEDLSIQSFESLRRSYASAGYMLVTGSFEAGGALTSESDVLLHKASGKAYSGPTGVVVPGTDPTNASLYIDRSGELPSSDSDSGAWRNDHILLKDAYTPTGLGDNTAAFNLMTKSAIDSFKAIDVGTVGTSRLKNAYLNDYTIGQAVSGSEQREHVMSFTGRGGKYQCPAFMATDDATSTDYVIRGNNSIGVRVGGFRVNGKGLSRGIDLSFIGNAAGGVAPSNGNEIYNLWVENFVTIGANFDQCNDTDIHGIFTRESGTTTTSIAVSLQGGGGFMSMRDSVIYGGRLRMACQNGTLTNIVMSGLELSGSSYNLVSMTGCHFIGMETYAIKSTAIGNATRAIELHSCYFPTGLGANGYIQGKFWRGGTFDNCQFTSGVITQSILPAGGIGAKPVFTFRNCHFGAPLTYDSANAVHVFINCTNADGSIFNFSDAPVYLPTANRLTLGLSDIGTSESICNTSAGWNRIASSVGGLTPRSLSGIHIGYNRSVGRGEIAMAYHSGGGSAAGIDFADASAGTYDLKWQMTNAKFGPATDNTQTAASASFRYSVVYAGTGTINTSDSREKTAPIAIDDAVLDAWSDVQLVTFQWLSSIAQKGDSARWHFGVVAQQVRDAFIARGLDGTKYGLLCYDEWDAEYEPVVVSEVVDGEIVSTETGEMRLVREAGNRWGIRPDQCLFLEAAYQRRRGDWVESRLEALEAK